MRDVDLGPMPSRARMRTLDVRDVRASTDVMFRLAADVLRWPDLLPHYIRVNFRERSGRGGVVEMAANRPFGPLNWPTWWVSLMQVVEGPAPRIRFRHIEGVTTRMEVEWRFLESRAGTRVEIEHLWNGPRWPLIGAVAALGVIGPVFVHGIASRTLAGLARVGEQGITSGQA